MNSIYDRINGLCLASGITIADLERKCELSPASIRKWKSGVPRVDKLGKVADYFGVSIDYLYGRSETKETADSSIEDKELLKICRARNSMPEEERKRMDNIIRAGFAKYFD